MGKLDCVSSLPTSVPAVILTGDTSLERLREVAASGHLLLRKPDDAERVR
ncbi:hypothetical protein [Rhizobium miluonense]|uniref:Response regulatory domain-containing protein n=1 Tax=Rhizobium miluonense TaxID=411945 RepID=A0A1C3UYV7_9HYPH|nr:hypothetical protein [Rhizobium miluonense]SCB20683.1 hypothetical protein GA0061102_100723 [Rhizobium miluonense]